MNLRRLKRDDPESIALVDGAIARMRDLAQALRPPMLDELGLEAALREHVKREAKRAGLTVRLALAPLEHRPSAAIEITCFRVAQEALTNVIRHAHAHRVEIELGEVNGTLQLVVRDDGRGFDVPAARERAMKGGSQGLLSIQERVALAGGDLEIDSAPGRGTCVRARLPLRTDCDA
jgi:signal transduction histidine kinase